MTADPVLTADLAGLRWAHVGLNCRDLVQTENFYRTWFGFERARVVGEGADRIVFLRRGPAYLELFGSAAPLSGAAAQGAADDGPHRPGVVRHLAFQTDRLDEFLDRIDGAVPVTLGPLRFDEVIPGWRTVWVSDPDGVVVEVSEGYRDPQDPQDPDAGPARDVRG
jgi:glyoxylase I family protein